VSSRRHETGIRIRREVLGDSYVDQAGAATTDFTAPFQDFITRTAWGDVWARPGLDRRTRSCITLAALTVLRADAEIAMHVRAALRIGLTRDEIAEVLLHTALYAGLPAANSAFAIVARALEEVESASPLDPQSNAAVRRAER
jgi:4-carboxymuconolactone decarboxylase